MQAFSWPPPPAFRKKVPPRVPSSYTSFGVEYNVEDGVPVSTALPSAKFDKDKLRELVNLSFSTFVELVAFPSDHERLIEAIGSIHLEINKILNGGKRLEAAFELKRIRNDHTRKKNRVAEEVRRRVSNFKI